MGFRLNAAHVAEPLTRSVEDYLKAIYRLSPGGQPAATSDIAQLLELAQLLFVGLDRGSHDSDVSVTPRHM